MTRDELLEKLRDVTGDPEADHSWADSALLAYIDDPEVTAAFDGLERWYA